MDAMYEICERFYDELDDIAKDFSKPGNLSKDDIEIVDKITHAIKSIKTVKAMENSGYSSGGSYYGNSNRGGNSYGYDDWERSERGGRGGSSNNNRSRDDFNSNKMRMNLERIMSRAQDEETRQAVRKMLDELR